jgi:hypothetical protein
MVRSVFYTILANVLKKASARREADAKSKSFKNTIDRYFRIGHLHQRSFVV